MEKTKDKETVVEEAAEYGSTARMIKEVKRHTRKRFTAEEKVKIVLEGSEFFSVFDLKLSPNRHFQPCVPVSV